MDESRSPLYPEERGLVTQRCGFKGMSAQRSRLTLVKNMIQNFSGGPGRLNVLLVPEDVQDALLPKATLVIR
jgi:hypothetical protein